MRFIDESRSERSRQEQVSRYISRPRFTQPACAATEEAFLAALGEYERGEVYVRVARNLLASLQPPLRVAWTRLKLAVEPTGALAFAAYLTGRVPPGSAEHPTVIVISGGNFDAATMARLLSA